MPPWLPYAAGAAALLALLALRCRHCCARKRSLRTATPSDVLHAEQHASGYSHRSLLTRLGGIARGVELIVTHDKLFVDVTYPFALVAEQVDLCHRIALDSIESVAARRLGPALECIITFRNDHGVSRQLSVFPESPDRFLRALGTTAPELIR